MGWRYFLYVLGCITMLQWICRFIFFQMFESPKFLLSKGRQAEAVAVVHGLAHKNKTKTWLTEEILNEVGGYPETGDDTRLSNMEIIKRTLNKFSGERIAPLFANWKLGLTTVLLWIMWTSIGMGYPLFNGFLPQYLKDSGAGGECFFHKSHWGETLTAHRVYLQLYHLPGLRYNYRRRRSGIRSCLLHGQHEVYWTQGYHGHCLSHHGHLPFPLHDLNEFEFSADLLIACCLFPKHYVWGVIRVYP